MTSAGSVGGDDRIRLFLALQLPEATLDVVGRWQAEQIPAGRQVAREHLHVTLAFLGGRPAAELPSIVDTLRDDLLAEIAQLRVVIEPEVAALAAANGSTLEILRLFEALEDMERHRLDAAAAVSSVWSLALR